MTGRTGARWAGVLAVTALLLAGCSGTSDAENGLSATVTSAAPVPSAQGEIVRMWIGPDRVECVGVAPMQCLQVSYSQGGASELFYDTIAGFEPEVGTAYVIDVQVTEVVDPPADASSRAYTLVSVISEEPQ